MNMEEYLNELKNQIRDKQAKVFISDEIKDHIEEQALAYRKDGMDPDKAVSKAVEEMGDPVSVGADLDRIHRPHTEWRLLSYILLITGLSIGVQYLINLGMNPATGMSDVHNFLKVSILGELAGVVVMLAVYRIDYTVLLGKSRLIGGTYLIVLTFLTAIFGGSINGMRRTPGGMSMHSLLFLWLPIFAGILYEYREKGRMAVFKIMLWMMAPILSQFISGCLSVPFSLFMIIAEMTLFIIALNRNWYNVNKKFLFCGLPAAFFTLSASGLAFIYGRNEYQKARLDSWLAHFGIGNSVEDNPRIYYINTRLSEVFAGSRLLGRNEGAVRVMNELPGYRNNLIIGSIAANCGKIAAAGVIVCIFVLAAYIFVISLKQKNSLGYIIGCACGVTMAMQSISNILIVFGVLPLTDSVLPLFSSGITDHIVDYCLLGLVLSIYRYKDIRKERVLPLTRECN